MQTNKIMIAIGAAQLIQCAGKLFFFESGASSTSDNYILVTPDSGTELRVKPGQKFVLKTETKAFTLKCDDPTAAISGYCVIGDGDFDDSNGTVTLSGSLNVVQVNNTNAQAMPVQKQALNTITNVAPVTLVTAGTQQALINDPTQRFLRIRNNSTTALVAIGATGVTIANAAIIIPPGGMWVEEEGAGAPWFAVSDTANTVVNIQGLK